MLSAQIVSLAKAVQSLQAHPAAQNLAPQIVHPPKALQPNVDPQARTKIEQLKRIIKNLAEPKSALISDPFDDLPRIILPPNCPLDFRKYNGTTDPLHHIKTFKMKIRPYTEDSQVLAYLFQRSLEGDALEWYYTLPIQDVQDFARVRDCFFEKYSHRVGYVPSLTDLIAEKMRPDEDFTQFADRW